MKKHKKVIFITLLTVVVLATTLGIVAFAQADDQSTTTSGFTSIWDRIASILKDNTGVTVSGADLQQASEQAHQQIQDEALDNMLKKLVESGKIDQKQADDYKAWLNERPSTVISDEFKQWMESRPEGLPFGLGERGPAIKRGFHRLGDMFRGWCAPHNAD